MKSIYLPYICDKSHVKKSNHLPYICNENHVTKYNHLPYICDEIPSFALGYIWDESMG